MLRIRKCRIKTEFALSLPDRTRFESCVVRARGFTLIELLITLAVVAIISVFAVPSYMEQVKRGKRAEAKAFVLDMASRQERFYSLYSSYTSVIVAPTGCTGAACGLGLGSNLSETEHYSTSVALLPSGCAPNSASPCSAFTHTVSLVVTTSDSACTAFTLTNTGVRGSTGTETTQTCWR
ncbi:type IV pilin protein [Teredinibacter waterburyi]|uniref:type IV pilin protein n=1 Tax=Teredinibacter waterburyi TaxID=1500538 RepID=UPI00165F4E7B|nr:type IV pilin protein [Teredinibacter waterburyi]